MENILLIDTTSPLTSVALSSGRQGFREVDSGSRRAAQAALSMVEQLLLQAKLRVTDLAAVAIVTGPGSFTGIRIGIGIAQGLCLAQSIPALPISSLAWYAQSGRSLYGGERMVVALPARDEEIYCGQYRVDGNGVALLGREQAAVPAELKPAAEAGTGDWLAISSAAVPWQAIARSLGVTLAGERLIAQPALKDLIVLARYGLAQGHGVDAAALSPNYVKVDMQYEY